MNKATLIAKMADKSGLTRKQAEMALVSLIDTVEETLASGDKVQIIGFGTFEVKERAAHTGRNPATGEVMDIAASKIPAFKPGQSFKDKM